MSYKRFKIQKSKNVPHLFFTVLETRQQKRTEKKRTLVKISQTFEFLNSSKEHICVMRLLMISLIIIQINTLYIL